MSQKKAILKDKVHLLKDLLKSDDTEIRLFSDYIPPPDIDVGFPAFIEASFAGYQRYTLDPIYWDDARFVDQYALGCDFLSPFVYNNYSSQQVVVKGYYIVKKSTEDILFYSIFNNNIVADQYETFSVELSSLLDSSDHLNFNLINLVIRLKNNSVNYIENANVQILNANYQSNSCDDCIIDVLNLQGTPVNNCLFYSVRKNLNLIQSNLTFTVFVSCPGFIDKYQDVVINQKDTLNIIDVDVAQSISTPGNNVIFGKINCIDSGVQNDSVLSLPSNEFVSTAVRINIPSGTQMVNYEGEQIVGDIDFTIVNSVKDYIYSFEDSNYKIINELNYSFKNVNDQVFFASGIAVEFELDESNPLIIENNIINYFIKNNLNLKTNIYNSVVKRNSENNKLYIDINLNYQDILILESAPKQNFGEGTVLVACLI